MNDEIRLPMRAAKVIMEMDDVCWNEEISPIGPDYDELLNAIVAQHPELVERYGQFDWPHKRKTKGDTDEQNR